MRRAGLASAALGVALLLALNAQAQTPPPSPEKLPSRRASFTYLAKQGLLRASFSYRDVVDASVQKTLASGLSTVIVMRAYVYPVATPTTPVAGAGRYCKVVWDVWDEVYKITITQPAAQAKTAVVVNLEGVLRNCAEVHDLPVAGSTNLTPGASYFLSVLVEVNPVSQDMLNKIRLWVTRPPGSNTSPGDSLFGSFVGLLVARIGTADKTLWFRTPSFTPLK